ncbi:hypothetical protein CRI77_25940 [Mycolicibacterium duvalii]|uniref:Uncharacterized protein n=1 Tax=Mycolicibacterium duvalii TaxID=39688 RepID=A0A7I7K3T9_9MYCO|nr:lipoprotein LpqH [Mycolicibacterium duvalii]MCV7367663.1 lipoprotein LpqH [Mycolicibacterium duvalii]PEG35108.1 hypothetical protein CRI77_25940 [Mycolicibacterium duvalii]BBX18747.1 hypothetical protein MDUV_36070 [Mycolicibacterium duvalii]
MGSNLHVYRVSAVLNAAAVAVAGCSSGYEALGTHTATVQINGNDIGEPLAVRCEQVNYQWYIESLADSPGFTAQIQAGESVSARGVQLEQLGGFTGSYWESTVGSAEAEIADGTVQVSGVAEGYYQRDPSERGTAEFVIRTDC